MKLSAPYLNIGGSDRSSGEYVREIAKYWIRVAPSRVLWGSDWPHTSLEKAPATASFIDELFSWVEDQDSLDAILVRNPHHRAGLKVGRPIQGQMQLSRLD